MGHRISLLAQVPFGKWVAITVETWTPLIGLYAPGSTRKRQDIWAGHTACSCFSDKFIKVFLSAACFGLLCLKLSKTIPRYATTFALVPRSSCLRLEWPCDWAYRPMGQWRFPCRKLPLAMMYSDWAPVVDNATRSGLLHAAFSRRLSWFFNRLNALAIVTSRRCKPFFTQKLKTEVGWHLYRPDTPKSDCWYNPDTHLTKSLWHLHWLVT